MSSEPRREWLCFHGLLARWRNDQDFREKAVHFLQSIGWTDEDIDEAFVGLARQMKDPQTVEEQIMCDANSIEKLVSNRRGEKQDQKCNIMVFRGNLSGLEVWRRLGWHEREDLAFMQIRIPSG